MRKTRKSIVERADNREILNAESDKSILGLVLMPSTYRPEVLKDATYSFEAAVITAACIRHSLHGDAYQVNIFRLYTKEADMASLISKDRAVDPEVKKALDVDGGIAALFQKMVADVQRVLDRPQEQSR